MNEWTAPSPPRDVIPPKGMTRESLKSQNDAVDTEVTVTLPGEVILDNEGVPAGVGPDTVTTAVMGSILIARADVERLGLTQDELANDYPNVTVFDPQEKS